jgi:Acetyltransferase (GNAT) domain
MTPRVETARTVDEVERLAPAWSRVQWDGEQAEHPYFLAAARVRGDAPFALFVRDGDRPVAAAVGRIERRRLETRVGYLRVYAPSVGLLQIVPGGIVADDPEPLVGALRGVLAGGEVDALALPALPVETELFGALRTLGGPLERQRLIPTWTRRRLVLPATFEEYLASRSRKVRAGLRYDAKKLLEALGDDLAVEIVRDPSDLDRVVHDLDAVAAATYQRALGAGFVDTGERRTLLRVALEHGWARPFLLRHRGEPVGYWLCSVHRDRITLNTTGYLPAYAPYRVGVYLLMRVIEDGCADPSLRVLDFGPGRSAYKERFSGEGYEERNLLVYAPTWRARRINLARTAVLGVGTAGRRTLDAAGLTDRLKTAWRGRLRRSRG